MALCLEERRKVSLNASVMTFVFTGFIVLVLFNSVCVCSRGILMVLFLVVRISVGSSIMSLAMLLHILIVSCI